MHKPNKPQKIILMESSTVFYDWDNDRSKKISLKRFLAWVKSTLPSQAKDVEINLREDWEYDDCIVSLELSWKKAIPNPYYEQSYKKYRKKLKKWKKSQ